MSQGRTASLIWGYGCVDGVAFVAIEVGLDVIREVNQ